MWEFRINFIEKYKNINQLIRKVRELLYDLVEIPHLLQPQDQISFKRDVKIVAQALDYIIKNQPFQYGNQASFGTQQYFQQLISLQEEYFALEEVYYFNFSQVQNSSSPVDFKILMQEKELLHQYFS